MLVSSYDPGDVTFLLTDLSDVPLELSLAERERAIQAGRNYAEMLPIEYAPSQEYLDLFEQILTESASQVAEHVGVITEMVLAARGAGAVLVSLARAGTPVGILMRRWAQYAHGVDLPHYSISIVRGVGIDTNALTHIAAAHRPSDVVFVDGWTGKGAIVRELFDALDQYDAATGISFPRELAVIADPADCADLAATSDDFLLPSACLNSTVCGLVSRTIFNRELLGPDDFHGAKVYASLAASDRSHHFLDAVCAEFAAVADQVASRWPQVYDDRQPPTFRGWAETERIQAEFDLPSMHLVKPSIGETTRVLLRRLPWQVLVNPDRRVDLRHIEVLASDRGVPVVPYPDMTYACVGLVQPIATDVS